jgi:hypothetical protein
VNDGGIAVGVAYVPWYYPQGDSHAGQLGTAPLGAVWMKGRLWDLAYMTGRSDLWVYDAKAINGSGQILVEASLRGFDAYSFILTPR